MLGLPYTIVRPSALYGPRCVSRRVVQVFIETASEGGPLVIEGDGSDLLDFTYIDDFVEGLIRVSERPASNEVFNMTYGEARTVRELAHIVTQHFNGSVEFVERDPLLPRRGTLSIKKAHRLLGYAPQHPLESGVPRYIQWYLEPARMAA